MKICEGPICFCNVIVFSHPPPGLAEAVVLLQLPCPHFGCHLLSKEVRPGMKRWIMTIPLLILAPCLKPQQGQLQLIYALVLFEITWDSQHAEAEQTALVPGAVMSQCRVTLWHHFWVLPFSLLSHRKRNRGHEGASTSFSRENPGGDCLARLEI